ncbi:MAG: phosphatase PAP2 family protein [Candidatus Nitrosocosmicus sp.]
MNKPINSIDIKHNPFWGIKKSYILVFLFCFLIITVLTITGLTKGLDNAISDFFRKIFRNEQSDTSVIIVTTSSDTINLIIIGFILTAIKKTRQFGMILLISIVTITIVVTYAKPFFAEEQPPYVFNPIVTLPDKFTLEKDSFMPFAQNYSYPSNHLASTTAFSFIIGGLIYKRYPYLAKGFMVLFPTAIGITKLYLLQQYFADLLGGFFLGLVLSSLFIKILKAEPGVKSEY